MTATVTIPAKADGKQTLAICLFLALSTLLVYWPVTHYDFVSFDDPDFITNNPTVQAGLTWTGIKWAMHSEVARNWHPVTMITHMLDCQFYGTNAGRHHLTNLLFHIANTLLLFFVLKRLTGAQWRSAIVAALFALHPLHVESVAWIAERKDVLSALFWLLTMWTYTLYAEALKNPKGKPIFYYILTLALFTLGMMSKPMLVTLPCVLLLLDFWPLGRFGSGKKTAPAAKPARPAPSRWRLVLEKVPFFGMSAWLSYVTYAIQDKGGATLIMNDWTLAFRLQNATASYVRYIGKMFWPENLTALYLKTGDWPIWAVGLAGLFLAGMSVLAVWQWRRRPWLAVGWFWYLGTLVPVIGIIQVGMQIMADRYTYVPLIGLFVVLVWGVAECVERWKMPRIVAIGATAAAMVACMVLTARQITYWKDSETFFKRMIAISDKNFMAHYNLGNLYSRQKKSDEAIAQYQAAIDAMPVYFDARNNLGAVLLDQKRYDEAIAQYREAARLAPVYTHYFNLANALADAGKMEEADAQFEQALRLNPDGFEAHLNYGMTLRAQKKSNEAIAQFQEAVRLNPGSGLAELDLANELAQAGRLAEATPYFLEAERLDPDRVDNYSSLGICYGMQGKMEEAAQQFKMVLRLRPDDSGAYCNLGNAYASENKLDEAATCFSKALELNPKDYQTEFNLGLLLQHQGKNEEAATHYKRALELNPGYPEAQQALTKLGHAPTR